MSETPDRKAQIEERFGSSAQAYADSAGHRGGPDLDRMLELAGLHGDEEILDVATGAGNTALAFAPLVRRVVALDLAEGMIATTRARFEDAGFGNAEFVVRDAENLPFADESFDVVTCRIALHHFLDVARSTREVFRVLRPGGTYLMEDSLGPDAEAVAAFLHDAECLRDRTHVRSYPRSEWIRILHAAGFLTDRAEVFRKRHDFEAWLERGGTPDADKDALRAAFLSAPEPVRAVLEIETEGGRVRAFTDEKILLAARRPVS